MKKPHRKTQALMAKTRCQSQGRMPVADRPSKTHPPARGKGSYSQQHARTEMAKITRNEQP